MTEPRIDDRIKKLLPPLSPEERAELEASILDEGIRDPLIVWDGEGILLDGHNRLGIAKEHDLPYRVQAMPFENFEAARRWVIRNQLGRRNIKPDAASYLRGLLARDAPRAPGARTDTSLQNATRLQAIAQETGVDRTTLHRDVKFADAVDTLAEVAGEEARALVMDGKVPRQDTVRLANTAKTDPGRVKAAIGKVLSGDAKDPKQALATVREEEVKAQAPAFVPSDMLRFHHGPFQTVSADMPPECADLIFTDPPYGKEWAHLWSDLGAAAVHLLKPGGLLLAYVGKLHFMDCMKALEEHLQYHWLCSAGYEGAKHTVWRRRFWGQWRPLAVFAKGTPGDHRYANDLLYLPREHRPDQTLHPWAQDDAAATYFIERLTEPGQCVIDPMCGTGVFVRTAAALGRVAIGIEADADRYAVALGLSAEADEGDAH